MRFFWRVCPLSYATRLQEHGECYSRSGITQNTGHAISWDRSWRPIEGDYWNTRRVRGDRSVWQDLPFESSHRRHLTCAQSVSWRRIQGLTREDAR